jgi:hypothetical protein
MATTASEQTTLDEIRQAEWQRSSEAPELLTGYLAKIGKGKLLAPQEEISLSRRARAGNQRARKKLVPLHPAANTKSNQPHHSYNPTVRSTESRCWGLVPLQCEPTSFQTRTCNATPTSGNGKTAK